jgi:hypothetical protein
MADDEPPAPAGSAGAGDSGYVLGDPLSVEDDEYAIVHGPDLVVVAVAGSLADARDRARHLVEHGLGATVAEVSAPSGFEVRVLPEEALRAAELLGAASGTEAEGVTTPAAPAPESGEPVEAPLERPPVPWKLLLAIWLAAMIVLPAVAFLGTYLVSR